MSDESRNGSFEARVASRFGLMPNFFHPSAAAPELITQLWAFAEASYLDNPLPSVFKERLFVYLSRFCEARYCIVRHVGFLLGWAGPRVTRTRRITPCKRSWSCSVGQWRRPRRSRRRWRAST